MADSPADVEAHAGGAKQTAKDLFAGAAGGVAQVLLGEWFTGSQIGLRH
jgi:solute carrier family 25 carnitine/acylcarnitine transporter 20/29